MRIHSSVLNGNHMMNAAMYASGNGDGDVTCEVQKVGSRKRDRAFEVRLSGDGTFSRRRTMDGRGYAATWSAWGCFLAYLFEFDADMIAGPYKGQDDFNRQTYGLFANGNMRSGHQPDYTERLALMA